ncbi:hypothetical protein [Paraburkholderia youngii]
MGLLLPVVVNAAGIRDRVSAKALLLRLFATFGSLQTLLPMAAS